MKSNKKTIVSIVILVIAIIMIIIGIVLANIVKKEETLVNNVDVIKNNYTKLSDMANENTSIRKELSDKLSTFNNETYKEEHDDYVEILTKYNNNIESLDEIITDTHTRCSEEYEDATINIICRSYDLLYEEIINLYVTNLNKYNGKINSYNENSTTDFELFEMLHKEYIDFNQDEKYRGKYTETNK